MKKWFFSLLILLTPFLAKADGGLFESIEDKSYFVRFNFSMPAATGSTTTVIIHLTSGAASGTTIEWPHRETGEIDITDVRLDVDKIAASTGTIRLGVVTAVNLSTGSVKWFYSRSWNLNASNTDLSQNNRASDNLYRLRVNPVVNSEGTTPFILSNETTLGSVIFRSTGTMPSPASVGLSMPGIGDLVMDINKDLANVWNVKAEIKYYTRRR